MMASLIVVRAGMLTTVQDLGRWGQQSSGVPVAGPMDVYSHRRANRLAGNPDGMAALEVTMTGPDLQARGDVVCAVAGAQFVVEVNGRAIDTRTCFEVADGAASASEPVARGRVPRSRCAEASTCRSPSAAVRRAW